jgi:hypothetical protein
MPGYANAFPGGGFGRGFRGGRKVQPVGGVNQRGRRRQFNATGLPGWMRFCRGYPAFGIPAAQYAQPNPEWEKQALKTQADLLQSELDAIKKRLSEIDTGTAA